MTAKQKASEQEGNQQEAAAAFQTMRRDGKREVLFFLKFYSRWLQSLEDRTLVRLTSW